MKRIEHKFENGIEFKWCGRCKQFKPISEFSKHSGKWDGLQERCNNCRHQQYQEQGKETQRNKDPEVKKKARRKSVIRSYGLELEDFENMLKIQNNRCAICGSEDWGKVSPSIDHDHKTGIVRALLCNRCNRTLGFLEDSPSLAMKMYKYLLNHGKSENE